MTDRLRLIISIANIVITLINIGLVILIVRDVREIRQLSREVEIAERGTQTAIAEMNEIAMRRI